MAYSMKPRTSLPKPVDPLMKSDSLKRKPAPAHWRRRGRGNISRMIREQLGSQPTV